MSRKPRHARSTRHRALTGSAFPSRETEHSRNREWGHLLRSFWSACSTAASARSSRGWRDPGALLRIAEQQRDLCTAQHDAVNIARAENIERFTSDVACVAACMAFHDLVDGGIEPDAERAVDRLAADVARWQAVRVDQRVAEAQHADGTPRTPDDLVQCEADHAQ